MKKKMPPILRWTLKKLGKRLSGLIKPKVTEDDIIEELKIKCDEAKIKLDIEFTKYPKHATKLAQASKDKYDLIIAAGGDGTRNEVINGMAESKATLVIIPFGSTNVLASELGIPNDPKKAAELITKGIKCHLGSKSQTAQSFFYFNPYTVIFIRTDSVCWFFIAYLAYNHYYHSINGRLGDESLAKHCAHNILHA